MAIAEENMTDVDCLLETAERHILRLERGEEVPATIALDARSPPISETIFPFILDLLLEVSEGRRHQDHVVVLVAEAYLRDPNAELIGAACQEAAARLEGWTIQVILPSDVFAFERPFNHENTPRPSAAETRRIILLKEAGLRVLSHLQRLHRRTPNNDGVSATTTIACLAAFTDPQNPWTTNDSYRLSSSVLSSYVSTLHSSSKHFDSVIKTLLTDHVKPLFERNKNPLLTAQARKAISSLPGPAVPSDFESENKPWKFQSPHVVTVFQWILAQLNPTLIEDYWPLIIPPLLTIIDDVSFTYKIQGCSLLKSLLNECPANLLERTGLGEIFQNTLMPYLLHLPSLTPEAESVPLLDSTYTALIALTQTRYGNSDESTLKTEALDAIFRYGVLKGFAHAGENVRVAQLLMQKSTDLVKAMGIYCVAHLKDLLPIVLGILTAPFATVYPPLLGATLDTLRAIILNGWPRVKYHRGAILLGLVTCWFRIETEEVPTLELERTKAALEQTVDAVVQLLRECEVAKDELQLLRTSDPRLGALLKIQL